MPPYPKVIETYSVPYNLEQSCSNHNAPSAFNGYVLVERYRITVEKVEEPIEVVRDRLRKLWRESERNFHHWTPMRATAERLGMDPNELKLEEQGADSKRRNAGLR